MRYTNDNAVPLEADEQKTLFEWARIQRGKYPELELMYHVPNGGSRNKAEAARMKGEGVRAGVPDVCLPVARGKHHGLYIELKRTKGGRISPEQTQWMEALLKQGYQVAVCKGWEAAAALIVEYLETGV